MIHLVIQVDKCPFHFVEPLQLALECLSDVVCLLHAHVGRQDDVDLHEEIVSEVESTDCVDVRHFWMMIQRYPRQHLQEFGLSCVACQQFDLL